EGALALRYRLTELARLRRFRAESLAEPLGARGSDMPASDPGRLAAPQAGGLGGAPRGTSCELRDAARARGPQPRLLARRALGVASRRPRGRRLAGGAGPPRPPAPHAH